MPKSVLEYRCLLISPSDVQQEREALVDVVNHWNAQIGDALEARLELVRWESHSIPDMSGAPQEKINEQLLESCDFAIAIFWYRVGTPTQEYESGSIEEIHRIRESGKRVLVYFSTQPIPQDALEDDQFARLQKIKRDFQREGLLGSFNDIAHLKQQVLLHVTSVVSGMISQDRPEVSQFDQTQTSDLKKPDIRVKVFSGFTVGYYDSPKNKVMVEIQNHSPMTVFLGNVLIKLKDGQNLFSPRDAITGEHQRRRELRPGEKFSFTIDPEEVKEAVDLDNIEYVFVKDDIERIYKSSPSEFRNVVQDMLNTS